MKIQVIVHIEPNVGDLVVEQRSLPRVREPRQAAVGGFVQSRVAGHVQRFGVRRIDDYREDVTDLLQWVGLGDRMYAYPPVLSGGEKQRAAIARAVIAKPELLLADEPTGNVDPQMARRLLRLFIELNRLGTSVVIATHDEQLMEQFKVPRLQLEHGHVQIV